MVRKELLRKPLNIALISAVNHPTAKAGGLL